jgi:nicotinamidase-related amidase
MNAADPPSADGLANPDRLFRSLELMARTDTALLVVDMQEKLLPFIPSRARLEWNVGRLIDGARLLGLPVVATEQYPRGLGPTSAAVREKLGPADLPSKTCFSCRECGELFSQLRDRGVYKILVCGIESHVCVQQTALDLLAESFRIYLAVDAIGARHALDHDIALRRMESSGATLTTVEAALFEWCETASAPEFKAISALVKQQAPE